MSLTKKKCKPCEGIGKSLTQTQAKRYLKQIPEWKFQGTKSIRRTFVFKNFKKALLFVNKVGKIAEQEGHHPDIEIHGWNKVTLRLWTHTLGGLTENDFIVAAKVDTL